MTTVSETRRYLTNILWSWLGTASVIASAVIVSPFVIRRLGSAEFGIWSLALSLVEYLWLIDLGFRPALVKLSAESRALGKEPEINVLVNTAAAVVGAGGLALGATMCWSAGRIAHFFQISHPAFPLLVRIVGVSWGFGVVVNVFAGVVEGYQRFDLTNHVNIASTLLRSSLTMTVIWMGYGLREMGFIMISTQLLAYAMLCWNAKHVYPALRLSWGSVRVEALRKLWDYGRQVLLASTAARISASSMPPLVAYYLPIQHVTYFSITQRVIDYLGDVISRVGWVTGPRAADWMARGRREDVIRMAAQGNRYCLAIWGLFAAMLAVYGEDFCRVWINAEVAAQVGALLPIMMVGYTLAQGQFISAAVLMGTGVYQRYAVSLAVETAVMLAALVWALPRYGLIGLVCVVSVVITLNRAVMLSWIFARQMKIGLISYLASIYPRPLAMIGVSAAALWYTKHHLISGRNLIPLVALGAVYTALYALVAAWWIPSPYHRQKLLEKLRRIL
jgi:O-antigen/teichoic acid export membrane protein